MQNAARQEIIRNLQRILDQHGGPFFINPRIENDQVVTSAFSHPGDSDPIEHKIVLPIIIVD